MSTTDAAQPAGSPYDNSLEGARAWFAAQGLTRPRQGWMIGGVVAGFARRYGVNVLVARVAALISLFLLFTPLVYIPLWILMPRDAEVVPTDS
jgi:phage shock protein C